MVYYEYMHVYFSGIGGVGIGPLAQIAHDAGYTIVGSDMTESLTTRRLRADGVTVYVGDQTDENLRREHETQPIEYFVYTAALPDDHPELVAAHELGIRCLKRDGLLARIVSEKNLRMVAVAGTHGKTTTTGLFVWVMKQLGLPVSYSVGTTLSFGPSGVYDSESQYFVYECDEYDRNFLHYTPRLSLITSLDYDHPDTYPTREQYVEAFTQFIDQSEHTLLWEKDYDYLENDAIRPLVTVYSHDIALDHVHLAGTYLRQNAFLVERAILRLFPDTPYHDLVAAINSYPGTDRRMEQIDEGIYTDYGHHPAEIAATLQAAREMSDHVTLVYQPHQNRRQHLIRDEYTDETFASADDIYWVPTYLSREDPDLAILSPTELAARLNPAKVHIAELDDTLWQHIIDARNNGSTVVCMGAGSIDEWVREKTAS